VLDIRTPPPTRPRASMPRRRSAQNSPRSARRALRPCRGSPCGGPALRRAPDGYLLKSRVTEVGALLETLERIAAGGSVIDPRLVKELVAARRVRDPLHDFSARARSSPAHGRVAVQRRYRPPALGRRGHRPQGSENGLRMRPAPLSSASASSPAEEPQWDCCSWRRSSRRRSNGNSGELGSAGAGEIDREETACDSRASSSAALSPWSLAAS
jgi:hypothetical protein